MIKGTVADNIVSVLKKIPERIGKKVQEVTRYWFKSSAGRLKSKMKTRTVSVIVAVNYIFKCSVALFWALLFYIKPTSR